MRVGQTASDILAKIRATSQLIWLFGGALGALALAAVVMSVLVVDRQDTLRQVSRYDITWGLNQVSNEMLRLVEAVSASAIPGSGIDRDAVEMRVDIVFNRLQLLNAGEYIAFIRRDAEMQKTVDQLNRTLVAAAPAILQLPDPKAALHLRDQFESMLPALTQFAALANQRSAEMVAEDQRQLSELHWSLTGLTFTTMAAAVILLWWIVHVRTRLLEEVVTAKQLAEAAREVAEAANLAKSEFLAKMSHELRTPMNGVLGMVELAQGAPSSPEQAGFLAIAHQSATFLLDLISGILDFARIESGKIELDEKPVNLRSMVDDVVGLLNYLVREKMLMLRVSIAPELPTMIAADCTRLRQVLTNLMGNAVKFTDTGEVALTVSLVMVAGARSISFEVRDTGIGISAAKLGSIFEPFIQANNSRTRRHGGTGLGLTIARQIVGAMGGTIKATSVEGIGSTFCCTMPLRVPGEDGQSGRAAAPMQPH